MEKTFDPDATSYPNGFHHDVSLIKPTVASSVEAIKAPIAELGWLDHEMWSSLRRQTTPVRLLGATESHRDAKTLKCYSCSDVLIVGEGVILNRKKAAGKSLRGHDESTWTGLISRALLYRVNPDFEQPNGYSGLALYADGTREDGSSGPGIVGFQSFVQRSGSVQNYDMEDSALEQRLRRGAVAFYGAFEVPEELRSYTIL
jgi:hypothetical protein